MNPTPEPAPAQRQAQSLPLPPGWRSVAELASGERTRVVHATGPRGEVALRLELAGGGRERAAELDVIGRLDHPGLARLVEFGSLDGGRVRYVARRFVEGVDLREWARGRDAREIGALVARLCPALEHLHGRGFLHADLKPENVIVTPDDRPVLTDFGLARSTRGGPGGPAAGTLFHVAPEVLLGGEVGPRADLFSLGVMLHELLVGRDTTAREFYALFPARPYFEALGARASDLPEFARELVTELVRRDPARRPASAAVVARTLRARLELEPDEQAAAPSSARVELPVLFERETFARDWVSAVDAGGPRAYAFAFEAGEDARAFFEELRYWLALEGTDAQLVALGEVTLGRSSDGELDALATRLLDEADGATLLLDVPLDDPRAERCAAFVARGFAARRARDAERAPRVVVRSLAAESAEAEDTPWTRLDVPPIGREPLAALLARTVEGETDAFADWLISSCGGRRARLGVALERAVEAGWLVPGAERPRLRTVPDTSVTLTALEAPDALATSGEPTRRLALALLVAGDDVGLDELAALAGLAPEHAAAAFEELVGAHAVRVVRRGDERRLAARFDADALPALAIPEDDVRAVHARQAEALRARGAGDEDVLPHALRADPSDERLDEVLDAARRLRESGEIARALTLVQRAEALERERAGSAPTPLVGELAIAWAALGFPERTRAPLDELEARGDDEARALAEEARGWSALGRREVARAAEHFEAAEVLSRRDGAPLWACALALYQAGRIDELERFFARFDERPHERLAERYRWNLEMIRELVGFRRGETELARERLARRLDDALRAGEEEREASVRLNLGTVERRTGNLDEAAAHFERAAVLHDRRGFLPGLAQARASAGGCRREAGELLLAETSLESALALRERLGDASGARAVRGMLGLLHADRGRLRAGLDELRASAAALREVGRTTDAPVLEARADELEARVGESSVRGAPEADPRVLVDRARVAWLQGVLEEAEDYAERARQLGERLGLKASHDEAQLLLHWLARLEGDDPEPIAPTTPRVADDHALLEHLAAPAGAFDVAGALALAVTLARRGREDRAARLALAVVGRANESERALALEAAALARDALATCTAGLTEEQASRARVTLLGIPDPWPDEVGQGHRLQEDGELEDMLFEPIFDIAHRLAAQENERDLLRVIVEGALQVAQAERGFLVLEEDGELRFDTARDSRHGAIPDPELETSSTVIRQALKEQRPLLSSNAVDDPLLGGAPSIEALELRSILCVPFRVDRRVRGAIYVDHRLREGAFGERALKVLTRFADQATIHIRQQRQLDEIKRLNAEQRRDLALRKADLQTARQKLEDAGEVVPGSGLVGSSKAMANVQRLIDRCARTEMPVLVVGGSGTGKELAARALHDLSPRRDGPFVGENCAALPPTLIEAELFGAKKGAFTGADRDRPGMFERAKGGTIFLDEIGELPLDLQSKLLRVLETSEVRRIGDSEVRALDFRLVAATNRDLAHEVEEGRFRADLMYRLDALRVEMPPLAARREDIPELVLHFLKLEEAQSGVQRKASPKVVARLVERPWPGNVRELANEVARLCVLSEGDLDDPELVRQPGLESGAGGALPLVSMAELERLAIQRALEACGGDKRKAAELLGISRAKVYQKLKEWRGEG